MRSGARGLDEEAAMLQHETAVEHLDGHGSNGASVPGRPLVAKARRRWLAVVAAVVFGFAGTAVGALVADDGDQVSELESDVASARDDVAALEDAAAEQAEVLEQCRDTAASGLELTRAVDELAAADTRYNLTEVGTEEETEALDDLRTIYLRVLGASTALERPAIECAGEDASLDEGADERGETS